MDATLEERVVARLREEKVKLWLAPYDDDGALTATASTYAAALDEADVAAVAATLRDLRRRAVEKLAAKRRRTVRGAGAAGEPFEVALDGGTAGADARAVLAAAGGYDGRVRVIAGGRALVDGATLAAQGWPSDAERAGRPLRAIRSHQALPAGPADVLGRLRSVFLLESACLQLVSSSLHVAAAYAEVIRVGALRPL